MCCCVVLTSNIIVYSAWEYGIMSISFMSFAMLNALAKIKLADNLNPYIFYAFPIVDTMIKNCNISYKSKSYDS